MQSAERYTNPAIIFHWVVAVLMLVNIGLALCFDHVPQGWFRPLIETHKSIGMTVLGLAVLRLSWRLSHPAPSLSLSYPRWQRYLAQCVHIVLYGLIFIIPLSGWAYDSAWAKAAQVKLRWFWLFDLPRMGWIMSLPPETKRGFRMIFGDVHAYSVYGLYAFVALHILGALKHQFVDKDPLFQRMGL